MYSFSMVVGNVII